MDHQRGRHDRACDHAVRGAVPAAARRDAIGTAGWSFFTTAAWQPEGGSFGIAAILTGTVLIGLTAIATHTPGVIVEQGTTQDIFNNPVDARTSDYVHGRFG